MRGLRQQGIRVVTPLEPEHRSGIVSFSLGSVEEEVALMDFLQQNNVLVSVRYTSGVGGVRVSCHLFNTGDDLDRLLELVGAYHAPPCRIGGLMATEPAASARTQRMI